MQRALIVGICLAIMGAVVGVHLVLRKMAFVAETLQHTVFPGIAIAFVFEFSLLAGAIAATGLTVVLYILFGRRTSVSGDSVLAILMTTALAIGVVVVSQRSGFQHDLTSLLFGRMLAIDDAQVTQTVVLTIAVVAAIGLLHKELIARAFDSTASAALGYRPLWLDLVLNICVAVAVVAAVRAVGTILLLAFLITPAVSAQLLRLRIGPMVWVSLLVSAGAVVGGLVGSRWLSLEQSVDVPAGATIVVLMTAVCIVCGGIGALRGRRASGAVS